MSQHTPGPWTAERPNAAGVDEAPPFWITDGERRIADVCLQGKLTDANARLIAAAPELLEALRECITDDGACAMNTGQKSRRIDAINRIARAALAKSEGAP